ncbi:MAG: anthranilate synthase component I [Nitrospinota bacterium]|nr:anthranilate synthase component I [Nitrospinota bacterium]
MIKPERNEFIKLSKKGNLIPVYREMFADLITPVGAFLKIAKDSRYAYLLESVEGVEKLGRYTFLGADPSIVIETSGRKGRKTTPAGVEEFTLEGDPLDEIKKVMSSYRPVGAEELPIFFGGAVGYIGYDTVRFFEKIPELSKKDTDIPDVTMMIADSLIIFDNVKQKVKVVVNAHVDGDPGKVYDESVEKIERLVSKLESEQSFKAGIGGAAKGKTEYVSNTEKERFKKSVEKCKHYIREGDIFQVVLAQRLSISLNVSAFDVYRALRTINPSPYMYYLRLGGWEVVGASPETLVRLENGKVTVRPIAGTRPRGDTEREDIALEKELLADEKELAEHIMLVDLGRNDVGRVSKGGAVKVTELKTIERYSHVMHITSTVEGDIADGKDCYDVLRATFPAGTLSGAPKIRAMEIIDELEPTRRGLYGGAVGYFGYSGNMDTAIAIRTLAVKGKTAYLGIGAGIVADSDPEKEWEETMNKGRALLKAVEASNLP